MAVALAGFLAMSASQIAAAAKRVSADTSSAANGTVTYPDAELEQSGSPGFCVIQSGVSTCDAAVGESDLSGYRVLFDVSDPGLAARIGQVLLLIEPYLFLESPLFC